MPLEFFKEIYFTITIANDYPIYDHINRSIDVIELKYYLKYSHHDNNDLIKKLFKFRDDPYRSYDYRYPICCLADNIKRIENIFSNFYDKIKIVHISVKKFTNINKKFDELLLKYIKQIYTENVLETIKRNLIDRLFQQDYNTFYKYFCNFNTLIHTTQNQRFAHINDFIVKNITIDFFAESEEYLQMSSTNKFMFNVFYCIICIRIYIIS